MAIQTHKGYSVGERYLNSTTNSIGTLEAIEYQYSMYGPDDYSFKFNVEGKVTSYSEYGVKKWKALTDPAFEVGVLVDIVYDGVKLRGKIIDTGRDGDNPYRVSSLDGHFEVDVAAFEMVKYIRAEDAERAGDSLKVINARIAALEPELEALKVARDVLENITGTINYTR